MDAGRGDARSTLAAALKNTMMHSGDIIIPTYNNESALAHTLQALFTQEAPAHWRWAIRISDDGSTDMTLAVIEKLQAQSPWPLTILRNVHAGSAAARNRAVSGSLADVILWLGADVVLRPGALAAHSAFHDRYPDSAYGALGYVTWDPRLRPSPFMEWMIHGGPQNDFDALLGQADVDPRHYFYGSHLSLKRTLMIQERFSETLTSYGWEDVELGRRLAQCGFILKPLWQARGLHHHFYAADDIIRRQREAGQTLQIYSALHPAAALLPVRTWRTRAKWHGLRLLGLAVALRIFLRYSGKHRSTPRLFFYLTTVEMWRGIVKAQ